MNNIKECHCASQQLKKGGMYNYRELLNNVATVYIANNVFFSSETVLFFRVYICMFTVAEFWLLCGYSAVQSVQYSEKSSTFGRNGYYIVAVMSCYCL